MSLTVANYFTVQTTTNGSSFASPRLGDGEQARTLPVVRVVQRQTTKYAHPPPSTLEFAHAASAVRHDQRGRRAAGARGGYVFAAETIDDRPKRKGNLEKKGNIWHAQPLAQV